MTVDKRMLDFIFGQLTFCVLMFTPVGTADQSDLEKVRRLMVMLDQGKVVTPADIDFIFRTARSKDPVIAGTSRTALTLATKKGKLNKSRVMVFFERELSTSQPLDSYMIATDCASLLDLKLTASKSLLAYSKNIASLISDKSFTSQEIRFIDVGAASKQSEDRCNVIRYAISKNITTDRSRSMLLAKVSTIKTQSVAEKSFLDLSIRILKSRKIKN